jgi:hypothetical protein
VGSRSKFNQAREASGIVRKIEDHRRTVLCRPAGAPMLKVALLPTADAVGYQYFVGFANLLTVNFDKRAFETPRYTRDAIQQIIWTGAGGACFLTGLVRRSLNEIAPPGQLRLIFVVATTGGKPVRRLRVSTPNYVT